MCLVEDLCVGLMLHFNEYEFLFLKNYLLMLIKYNYMLDDMHRNFLLLERLKNIRTISLKILYILKIIFNYKR